MIQEIKKINSIDAPEVELYRTLKKPMQHQQRGVFVVEGDKVVKRFLASSLEAVSVLLTEELFNEYREVLEKRIESIRVFITSKDQLKTIVGFRYHQGIMAAGKIPSAPPLETLIQKTGKTHMLVAVDMLESAENTGVLIRNCAALGSDGLIVGERSIHPYLRRSVRNSMGAIFKLPVIIAKLPHILRELRTRYGFTIFAAHPRPEAIPVQCADFKTNCCIVFGNEGEGVSEEVIEECDHKIIIPMASDIDSLNVACASAAVLYEATRQRDTLLHM